MRSVLSAIAIFLKNDPVLASVLEGGNIWDVSQPSDDQTLPTVTMLWHENTERRGSRGLRLAVLQVDIWDIQGSTIRAEKIRDELEHLLDYKILTIDTEDGQRQWIRLFMGSEAQVPTEVNETLVHWTIDFDVRYWRQAWVERSVLS